VKFCLIKSELDVVLLYLTSINLNNLRDWTPLSSIRTSFNLHWLASSCNSCLLLLFGLLLQQPALLAPLFIDLFLLQLGEVLLHHWDTTISHDRSFFNILRLNRFLGEKRILFLDLSFSFSRSRNFVTDYLLIMQQFFFLLRLLWFYDLHNLCEHLLSDLFAFRVLLIWLYVWKQWDILPQRGKVVDISELILN